MLARRALASEVGVLGHALEEECDEAHEQHERTLPVLRRRMFPALVEHRCGAVEVALDRCCRVDSDPACHALCLVSQRVQPLLGRRLRGHPRNARVAAKLARLPWRANTRGTHEGTQAC